MKNEGTASPAFADRKWIEGEVGSDDITIMDIN